MKALLPMIAIALVIIGFLVVVYAYSGVAKIPNLPNLPTYNPPVTDTPNPDVPTANPPDTSTPETPDSPPLAQGDWGVSYTLTISVASSGGTTNPSIGSHEYGNFTYVTVSATPSSGYMFSYWVLDAWPSHESANPIQIYMDRNHQLTAYFEQSQALPSETYVTKYFWQNQVIDTASAHDVWSGTDIYSGTRTQSVHYPFNHYHEYWITYSMTSSVGDSDLLSLTVTQSDGKKYGPYPYASQPTTVMLTSNSLSEEYTFSFTFRTDGQDVVKAPQGTITFYVTEWPASQLSMFDDYSGYIGPFGFVMIAAGAILLATMGRKL